jgi:NADP-dependent 3-hydroxy acid dehydrogenase YdfG
MNRLEGKVAVVTGGSRGIGKAIGYALGEEGAQVFIASRSQRTLDAAVREIRDAGFRAEGVPADVTSPEQVEAFVGSVVKSAGRIDILVNNAGMGVFKQVTELTVEDFDTMWNVNVRGVFLVTKAVLPHMIKGGGGTIVNIASLAGKNSFKEGAGYSATKWALRGFASSLMLEVRDHDIRVVTIFPGSVDTSFSTSGKRGPRIPQPEDVASAVVFAVTAPERAMFSEIDLRPTRPV